MRFGREFWFFLFWSDPCGPGRLRNLNIPIGILRFPARAGQGPLRILKTQFWGSISPNFMKFPIILVRIHYFHGKSDSGVPGEECARCNHWETIGITVISACQRRRAQNWWNWRNFMKFMKFHEKFGRFVNFNENHDFCVFSHPQPFTKPWYSLGNSKGWRAWHPREAAKPIFL